MDPERVWHGWSETIWAGWCSSSLGLEEKTWWLRFGLETRRSDQYVASPSVAVSPIGGPNLVVRFHQISGISR